jgi:hypothetical protein
LCFVLEVVGKWHVRFLVPLGTLFNVSACPAVEFVSANQFFGEKYRGTLLNGQLHRDAQSHKSLG